MSRILTPIGRCSAKLRRRLEIEEEEALAFRIKIRRRQPEDELAKNASGGRWVAEPNFATPGPFASRPESPQGFVSFHWGLTTVSKSPSGKSVVTSSRGLVNETYRTLGDHDEYVARPGAVMTIGPAEYDQYAARADVTDLSTGEAQIALVSNISLDPAERASFWNAVDATARKAGPDRLILDPARGSRKEWKALAAADGVPANLRQIAAEIAAGERTRKAELPMSDADAKAVIDLICRFVPNADRKKGPVRFARGRKGRTQFRLEAELPDGLDDAARVRIMFRLADAVEETGAMFTLAIHEPDEHNDDRNYHLHLVAHDRPAELIDGQWDFTIAEAVEGQRGRVRFSERKKKIVVDSLTTTSSRGDFETFLKAMRWKFAELCNEELRAACRTRLFDPRKYSEMGIDRKPTKPLGTRLAPLEAAGIPTKVGIPNAEIIWTYELKVRLERCKGDRLARQESIDHLQTAVDRLPLDSPEAAAAQVSVKRAREAAALLDVAEPELAEYEVTLAMARARPGKVVDTCARILKEIEAGGGSSTDRRNRARIEQRQADAAAFLAEINRIDVANQKVIAGQWPAINRARSEIAAAADLAITLETSTRERPALIEAPTMSEAKMAGEAARAAMKKSSDDQLGDVPAHEVAQWASVKEVPVQQVGPLTLETVIARISEDRLVVLGPEHHGGDGYRVGKITREELGILRAPYVAERAQSELARIAKQQAEEIYGAYLVYRSLGRVRAEEVAAASTDRPTKVHNPLGTLMAYKDHPDAARLMGWKLPEAQRGQGGGSSFWRRIRHSVEQALLSPEKEVAVSAEGPVDEPTRQPWPEPAPVKTPAQADPSRDAAIDAYAQIIRTDPQVVLVSVEGQWRVDPRSIPDWSFSATAWEDHEVVKAAVEDRLADEQKKEQQFQKGQAFSAAKRAEIVAELEAGRLVARSENGAWVVTGMDDSLVFIARKWRDHPELVAAFQKSRRPQAIGSKPLAHTPSPRPQAPATRPHLPSSAATSATPSSASILAPPPSATYTPAEEQWMRDRQSGRSWG